MFISHLSCILSANVISSIPRNIKNKYYKNYNLSLNCFLICFPSLALNWSFLSSISLANWIKSTKYRHPIAPSTPIALLIPTQELFDSQPSLKESINPPWPFSFFFPEAYKKALPVFGVALSRGSLLQCKNLWL